MSGADTLRRAAVLMRERAQAVEHLSSPWKVGDSDYDGRFSILYDTDHPLAGLVATCADYVPLHGADHIASWHPAVALAVADWLDHVSDLLHVLEGFNAGPLLPAETEHALAVARAYLGES